MRHLFLTCLTFFSIVSFSQDWQFAKEKNEIKVFTRSVEGSEIKEFKANTVLPFDKHKLLEVILDVENYPKWIDKCKSSKPINASDTNIIYHVEISLPFPLDNRDLVSKMKWQISQDEIKVDVSHIDDVMEPQAGLVRMPFTKGSWVFKTLENNETEVFYQYRGDPGGNLPAWAVNAFLVDGPIATLTNLQAILRNM